MTRRAYAPRQFHEPKAAPMDPIVAEYAADEQDDEVFAPEKPSMRPEMRASAREEDPRSRAARRAAEIQNHVGDLDEGPDDFFIDQSMIPAGWSYEWKRKSTYGAEDPAYAVQLARKGWEAVPSSRHPSYMPEDHKGLAIERKGMVLMERPAEITEQVRQIELRKARNQVRQKEEQLNAAPSGQFERDSDPRTRAKISKSYEAIPIPKD